MSDTIAKEVEPFVLLHTKLQRPRLGVDLVPRPCLLQRLHRGLDRKVTLISAMAGAGKTTLLAQWLEECPCPSAWLSLDEYDNDLAIFLSYLIAAIQTVYPEACKDTQGLLNALQAAPVRYLTASLVNELHDVADKATATEIPYAQGLIIALDDYHHIAEPAIHELVSGTIEYLPQGIHLAIASRTDPPLQLVGLRAGGELNEFRSADLRFTLDEENAFLKAVVGRELDGETVDLLHDKTEGWAVGLRLAALTMRGQPDDEAFVRRFGGTSSALIVEYLVNEVLAQQPPAVRDCMLRTSILDCFCAELCRAVCQPGSGETRPDSRAITEELVRANLFLVPLDEEGRWFRYHRLFRELLHHRLEEQCSAADLSALHESAGAWYAQNGWLDEALHHLLTANDTTAAADLVARHRYALMNQAQWQRLDQLLHRFAPGIWDQYPDLLMLEAWLLYHRGQWAALPAALNRLEASLARISSPVEAVHPLQGEISALRSLVSYHALDAQSALAYAQASLELVPRTLWIVRAMSRMYLAGALQMQGDLSGAYAALNSGFEQELQSDACRATLLVTICNIHWQAADLQSMEQAASRCIALSQDAGSPQILGWGHYHLGRAQYHRNDLPAAERHFSLVVQHPYLNYGICYVYSACGLALTYQAQGRPDKAREVAAAAVAHMLDTGNTTLLPAAQAFQAELALMQGQVAAAGQWAARLDPVPPLSPQFGLFAPHLTLVRVWLAQGSPVSRRKAADLLGQLQAFFDSTHNTRFLIETLALQATLYDAEGDEPAALSALEQAITLAEPGGFLRLFVDLGPPMARLLEQTHQHQVAPEYTAQILAAFPKKTIPHRARDGVDDGQRGRFRRSSVVGRPSSLIQPLTPRELQVLALLAQHLTNKEIAQELVVSPSTVKTHTLSIYRKLEARGRRQAVTKANELGILPQT